MGFLDDLFSVCNYIKNKTHSTGSSAPTYSETGNEPDFPVSFAYNCNIWLCVKSNDPIDVIKKLGLKNCKPSNWEKGIKMASNDFDLRFVSPVLDGYVLVVNFGMGILTLAPERLEEKAKLFDELQYFITEHCSGCHAWVKYVNGVLVRGYYWCGSDGRVILNKGELTPEEISLGYTNLLPTEKADWETHQIPDDDYVVSLATAWGIDPTFSTKNYPKSTGYICK